MKLKPDPDERDEERERSFDLDYNSLMGRLLRAGLITHYEASGGEDGDLNIVWNPDYQSMGGDAAFLALSSILRDLCPEGPLSTDEQMLIQFIRKEYWDDSDDDADA